VQQWQDESPETQIADHMQYLATRAAQWGADQELEACCEWLDYNCPSVGAHHLRADRRPLPNPPSLKGQALEQLDCVEGILRNLGVINTDMLRRAVEALPE
jgi:hypothetical protein